MGIVRQSSPGMFALTPLGLRSLEKLIKIVDEEMRNVGCQKLQLPLLTIGSLWKTTGTSDKQSFPYLNTFYLYETNNLKYQQEDGKQLVQNFSLLKIDIKETMSLVLYV